MAEFNKSNSLMPYASKCETLALIQQITTSVMSHVLLSALGHGL